VFKYADGPTTGNCDVPYTAIAGAWLAGSSLAQWPAASVGGHFVSRTVASVAQRDGRRSFAASWLGDDAPKKAHTHTHTHTHKQPTHTNHIYTNTHTTQSFGHGYLSRLRSYGTTICVLVLLLYMYTYVLFFNNSDVAARVSEASDAHAP
jgi:hypothetical protein